VALSDDRGKTLRQTLLVREPRPPVPIEPGKDFEDLLLFEPPADGFQALRLELPALAFGGVGTIYFQIPPSMLKTSEGPAAGGGVAADMPAPGQPSKPKPEEEMNPAARALGLAKPFPSDPGAAAKPEPAAAGPEKKGGEAAAPGKAAAGKKSTKGNPAKKQPP